MFYTVKLLRQPNLNHSEKLTMSKQQLILKYQIALNRILIPCGFRVINGFNDNDSVQSSNSKRLAISATVIIISYNAKLLPIQKRGPAPKGK